MFSIILSIYFALLSLFLYLFEFHFDDMAWDKVNAVQILHSKVPFLSKFGLILIRGLFAAIIWSSVYHICTDKGGLRIVISMRDNSKRELHVKYFERLTMFTVWSWLLQGFYFAGTTLTGIWYLQSESQPSSIFLLNLFKVLFEISFPVAFMVSLIVTYILIPAAKRLTGSADNFFTPMGLLFHNANVVFMVFEIICNRIPLEIWHIQFMILYGMLYSVFSWFWNWRRGVYYYFFMDYERPGAVYWYVGLLSAFSLFYLLSCALSAAINSESSSFIPYMIVLFLAWASMKLKDN